MTLLTYTLTLLALLTYTSAIYAPRTPYSSPLHSYSRRDLLKFSNNITEILPDVLLPLDLQFSSCEPCLVAISLIEVAKVSQIKQSLRVIAIDMCNIILQDKNVCADIMIDYFDAFVDNFFARYLSSQHICVFLKACESHFIPADFNAWKDQVLSTKPIPPHPPKPRNNNPDIPSAFNVLHLTDLHTDLEYTMGSLANCNQPFCCRPESSTPVNVENQAAPSEFASYWGSYAKCDIPLHTVDALLADSKMKMGNIDMILWTGDSTSHDVWHQSKANQTLAQAKISELIEQHFPGIPKFPMFGNHECFPADQYDVTATDSTRWMRLESGAMWRGWLSPASIDSLINNGYYAEYNKTMNVRVIALNTQACDLLNFNLIRNVTDPNAQIEFLIEQLLYAEEFNQKAFLIGHIPYGDNTCASQWARRIQVLVDRFEHTIIGQFFGHTHNDHVESVMSVEEGEMRSVGTVFIAPSGTTYAYHNPSFRIFVIEDEKVENYYQFRLDIRKLEQNRFEMPAWDLAYDFKSEYGLMELSNESVYLGLVRQLATNDELLAKYIQHYDTNVKAVDTRSISHAQRVYFSCMAANAVFDEKFECLGYIALTSPEDMMYRMIEFIQGDWQYYDNQKV